MERPEVVLVLHNIRSALNVGAIFRVADAAGVAKIYLTGYTPAPRDRFGRVNNQIAKTALGAENFVPWEKRSSLPKLTGYQLVALEQSEKAIDYKKVKIKNKTAIVVGNEVRGVSPSILKKCDVVAEIPMHGKKESLNVATATAIFLFRLLDK